MGTGALCLSAADTRLASFHTERLHRYRRGFGYDDRRCVTMGKTYIVSRYALLFMSRSSRHVFVIRTKLRDLLLATDAGGKFA